MRKINVEVNFKDLLKQYDNQEYLHIEKIFKGDDDLYLADFSPKIEVHSNKEDTKVSSSLSVCFDNVKHLTCDFKIFEVTSFDEDLKQYHTNQFVENEMEDSDEDQDNKSTDSMDTKSLKMDTRGWKSNGLEVCCDVTVDDSKLEAILVEVDITFEPREKSTFNHYVQQEFSLLKMPSNTEDFRIICEERGEIRFNSQFLCKISDVFSAMIENPNTLESKKRYVVLENVSARTVNNFKRILCERNGSKEDLDFELLMFADRYNIQPLVKICKSQIMKSISKENLIDIVKTADALNDDQIMKAVAGFLAKNKGSFENNPEYKEMMMKNSKCFTKILVFMMFKD